MALDRAVRPHWLGPALYGLLFVAVLPVGLVAWARAIDARVILPAVQQPIVGAVLVAAGSAIWIAGVLTIIQRGGGLPMNAFPPARYVSTGIYALTAHPIYLGWTIGCAGVAIQTGSAAGLWVVTPVVAWGCAALVLGYERHDLQRRFGEGAIARPWLSLPPDEAIRASVSQRLATALHVLTMLAVAEWVTAGRVFWMDAAGVAIATLLTPTRATLRRFAFQGVSAVVVLALAWLADPAVGASSAVHVLWAALAAEAVGARSHAWAAVAVVGLGLFVFLLPSEHGGTFAGHDLVLFMVAAVLVRRPLATWRAILDITERLANSWRAWRIGPMRVISHGVFAGLAAAAGVLIIGTLAGPESLPVVAVVAVAAMVGAALWAQLIEGSPALLRPFGYYGGVIGGLLGFVAVGLTGQPVGVVAAATAVAMPWIQSFGRLRCLVQGCCHGGLTDPRVGIRVTNPHSRAVALAHLDGKPIHATQLYSIAGNVAIGLLLWRAWTAGSSVWFVTGLYFICAGLARFIEEGFRAEPQTIRWRGLPMYQYLAIGSVLVGVLLTTWGGSPAPAVVPVGDARVIWSSVLFGALYWFAMGVDFPESSRRFARLSG